MLMAEDGKSDRSFKVQDRRRFTETGETRDEEASRESSDDSAESTSRAGSPEHAHGHAHDEHGHSHHEHGHSHDEHSHSHEEHSHDEPFEISFAAFVISLSTQALAHLGEMPNPIDGTTRVDLGASRQIIDIISMLRDKTKGNLDDAESALVDNALYDLRMKYVERAQGR
jgi:hypothetical protein